MIAVARTPSMIPVAHALVSGQTPESLGDYSRVGVDSFPLPESHPLKRHHLAISEYYDSKKRESDESQITIGSSFHEFLGEYRAKLTAQEDSELLLVLLERDCHHFIAVEAAYGEPRGEFINEWFRVGESLNYSLSIYYSSKYCHPNAGIELPVEAVEDAALVLASDMLQTTCFHHLHWIIPAAMRHGFSVLSQSGKNAFETIASKPELQKVNAGSFYHDEEFELIREKLEQLCPEKCFLLSGRMPWIVNLRATVSRSTEQQDVEFLRQIQSATSTKPSKKWLRLANESLESSGFDEAQLWELVADATSCLSTNTKRVFETESLTLKGLCWILSTFNSQDACRAIGSLAGAAYKKVPGEGPQAVKVGNAAVWALGQMESDVALAQLAYLKVRVKYGSAQKLIAKALAEKAKQLGVPEDEVEEMGVPAYGLTGIGLREEQIGEYTARMTVDAKGKSILHWIKPDGKIQKSVPAAIKVEFAADIKELKAAGKDLAKMLPAQRDRLDNLFLRTKPWGAEKWRERYLDHPVVGILARKLIWIIYSGEDATPVCWTDGQLADVAGQPVALADEMTVSLWHPLDGSTDDVLAWRERLEELGITQPFKQAHREVYVLTDAERNTGTYSNRFAAHILKQHQFNALAQARGWKSATRMMVDDTYLPPTKRLPENDLRVEFWVEGVGDDWDEQYVLDSGSFRYVATDQVRFYEHNAAENYAHASGGAYDTYGEDDASNRPLALDQIDRKVFSETLRDVDLFVGVASVGNDPNWNDGGLEGHFRDYWHDFSFGELSASANTRKAVLERLVPRLKIADRCSFSERFLIVRGDVRTYHIHLGSGNIQMEPNNEYLCIVPNASINRKGDAVTLPFEGDRTLSIILSKALLLAEDTKIKDSTILSQIRR